MKAIQKTMTKTKFEIGCQEQHFFGGSTSTVFWVRH